jgi:hypothetical protein
MQEIIQQLLYQSLKLQKFNGVIYYTAVFANKEKRIVFEGHFLHIYPLWLCRIEKNFSEPIMVFPERRCFLHLFADLWHEVALQPVSPKLATVF